jgi:hypothetical protein
MYLSDINRLEKYLAKFKYYVNAGHTPTAEETTAIQAVANQVAQIEEILFNLRAAKGSIAGLMLKSLQDARPAGFEAVYLSANEKGFSISVPVFSLIHNPQQGSFQNYNLHEQVRNWAMNYVQNCQRHFRGQELPESEIKLVLNLNQIHPKLKMYNVRFTGSLEFNFEISKKVAQNDNDREMIVREIMIKLERFIIQQRVALGLPEVVPGVAEE